LPLFGRFCSAAVDPVEKKPLYHWRPGEKILSLGSLGCNLDCPFCQNAEIAHPAGEIALRRISPEEIAEMAVCSGVRSLAFTYNEPLIAAEYLLETIPFLLRRGIASVLVTNGYVAPVPLEELIASGLAAANVDLKAFTEEGYARLGGHLAPVLSTLGRLQASPAHLEVTTLLVPGLNDDEKSFVEEVEFLAGLSPNLPLHLTRAFPRYRWKGEPTPLPLLHRFRDLADRRLRFVYLGNVDEPSVTKCPQCGDDVLVRLGYNIFKRRIGEDGKCSRCGFDLGIRVQST
jgi:pyruvate formate lyase activating enzyme